MMLLMMMMTRRKRVRVPLGYLVGLYVIMLYVAWGVSVVRVRVRVRVICCVGRVSNAR